MMINHAALYWDSMRHQSFDYALYESSSFTDLCSDMIEFLDKFRHWHLIVNITDSAAVMTVSYSSMLSQIRTGPFIEKWELLTSTDVKQFQVNLKGDVNTAAALDLLTDVDRVIKYITKSDFSALLMCDSNVVVDSFNFCDSFKNWLKNNLKMLLKNHKTDLQKHDIIAIIRMYTSDNMYLQTWNDWDFKVTLSVKFAALRTGSVDANTLWVWLSTSSLWRQFSAEKQVIFFTEVKIAYIILSAMKQKEKKWCDSENNFTIDLSNGECCETEMKKFEIDKEI